MFRIRSLLPALAALVMFGATAPAWSMQEGVPLSLNPDDYSARGHAPPLKSPTYILISTSERRLYLYREDGVTFKYNIAVGRPGFTWHGKHMITAKRTWPDWTPPAAMIARKPDLPRYMAGGPGNPLGAAALYIGNTEYRIHGTNDPKSIGKEDSSGCFRMLNKDILDLYSRVEVGTWVVVLK